jgi:hypothetical protein
MMEKRNSEESAINFGNKEAKHMTNGRKKETKTKYPKIIMRQ